jgi:hypothetical protein
MVDDDTASAELLHGGGVMADKQDGLALLLQTAEVSEAFVLKARVPNRQRFIDDQDVRLCRNGCRKRHARKHA